MLRKDGRRHFSFKIELPTLVAGPIYIETALRRHSSYLYANSMLKERWLITQLIFDTKFPKSLNKETDIF